MEMKKKRHDPLGWPFTPEEEAQIMAECWATLRTAAKTSRAAARKLKELEKLYGIIQEADRAATDNTPTATPENCAKTRPRHG